MRNRILLPVLTGILLVSLSSLAVADVPQNMNVQGQLTDSTDAPRVGTFFFTFKVFDAEAGGTEIWPRGVGESHTITTDAQGTWDAILGGTIALTATVFRDTTRWLEIRVTDGIDPDAILPRVKLGTGPYSYRSASSQQADAADDADLLDGLNSTDFAGNEHNHRAADITDGTLNTARYSAYGDLGVEGYLDNNAGADLLTRTQADSQFVNTTGDTMTGDLQKANGANTNAVLLSTSGADAGRIQVDGVGGGGDFRVEGDVTGDGIWFRVESGAPGNQFLVDNIGGGILGVNIDGANNIRFRPGTAGNGSVVLPADAITDGEIQDEPGIAQSRNALSVMLSTDPSSMTTITSSSITIPTSGYIYATARCAVNSAGSSGNVFLQVTETAGAATEVGYYSLIGTDTQAAESYYDVTHARTWFKNAGTYTFYFQGAENSNGAATAGHSVLTLMFFPTAYGTVTTLASQDDAGEFDAAKAVPTGGALPGMDGAVMQEAIYEVDLRDLELKAARAEAAAERAQRDLLEARAMSDQEPASNTANGGLQGDQ